jgi:hypothetical protein
VASLNRLVDERFWTHRQRSTSLAGIATGVTAICLFYYRFLHDTFSNWDLLAVGLFVRVPQARTGCVYTLTDL